MRDKKQNGDIGGIQHDEKRILASLKCLPTGGVGPNSGTCSGGRSRHAECGVMEKAAAFFTRQIMPLDEFNTFSTGGAISYLFLQKASCALDFWGVKCGA